MRSSSPYVTVETRSVADVGVLGEEIRLVERSAPRSVDLPRFELADRGDELLPISEAIGTASREQVRDTCSSLRAASKD